MKKTPPLPLRATAFHEAGHAVACIHERVALSTVSITPKEGSDGRIIHRHLLSRCPIDSDTSTRNRLRMERMVRMALAGPAAQRRFSPRSIRHYHSADDYKKAVDLVQYFVGSDEELEAYIKLLEVQAESFLNKPGVWDQITALATALLKEGTLPSQRVRSIVRTALERSLGSRKAKRMMKASKPQ